MKNKNILITGAAGFIGSNLCEYILKTTNYNIIALDNLTYAGNVNFLPNNSRLKFVKFDIRDKKIYKVFEKWNITDVIHLAAETHVDNSIINPSLFIDVNVVGTHNVVEAAYKYWKDNNLLLSSRFHHVSTDEVYGSLEYSEYFTEESKYSPNSPYSASKASSDHIVRSYIETFNLNATISNCSNNFGKHQHEEKLIPKVIKCILENKKIPLYGNGKNERDWLFVEDHCVAIMEIFENANKGDLFLIGTGNVLSNYDIISMILNYMNKSTELIEYVNDRLGHDKRYAINSTKLNSFINYKWWSDFEQNLINTIEWYKNYYMQGENYS